MEEGCGQKPWGKKSIELLHALKEFAGMLLLVLCEPQLTHCQEKKMALPEACFHLLHYALTVCMEVAAL